MTIYTNIFHFLILLKNFKQTHPDGLKLEAIGAGDIVTQVHFKLIGQNESVNNRNKKDLV